MPGDTGDFSNTIFSGFPIAAAGGSATPFLENDAALGEMDAHFGGNYLNQDTILQAPREAGLSNAIIGKLGPVLIFDHTERTGERSMTLDDSTGCDAGFRSPPSCLPPWNEPDSQPKRQSAVRTVRLASDHLRGRGRRQRVAAGPRNAWQLQPRGYPQHDGGCRS